MPSMFGIGEWKHGDLRIHLTDAHSAGRSIHDECLIRRDGIYVPNCYIAVGRVIEVECATPVQPNAIRACPQSGHCYLASAVLVVVDCDVRAAIEQETADGILRINAVRAAQAEDGWPDERRTRERRSGLCLGRPAEDRIVMNLADRQNHQEFVRRYNVEREVEGSTVKPRNTERHGATSRWVNGVAPIKCGKSRRHGAAVVHVKAASGDEAVTVGEDKSECTDSRSVNIHTGEIEDISTHEHRRIEGRRILTFDDPEPRMPD